MPDEFLLSVRLTLRCARPVLEMKIAEEPTIFATTARMEDVVAWIVRAQTHAPKDTVVPR
jgi:hypothetical protein